MNEDLYIALSFANASLREYTHSGLRTLLQSAGFDADAALSTLEAGGTVLLCADESRVLLMRVKAFTQQIISVPLLFPNGIHGAKGDDISP